MSRGRMILGGALVVVGALLLLGQLGYLDAASYLARWWPLIIVALGVAQLVGQPRAGMGPLIVTLVGLVVLLATLGVLTAVTMGLLWPVVLVLIGVGVLFSRSLAAPRTSPADDDTVDLLAIFGGLDYRSVARHFRGGAVSGFFGGVTLDLRDAQLQPEGAVLQATAVFGGVEIRVPEGWRVTMTGLPIFGGYSDKTGGLAPPPETAPHLHVEVLAIFGGVEVKHVLPGARPEVHPAAL